MATCPRCGTALKDEYGMSQCPGCGAFCFIDMDGNAVVQESSALDENYVETSHVEPGGAASPPEFNDPIENVIDVPAEISPDISSESSSQPDGFGDFQQIEPFGSSSDDFQPIDMSAQADESETPAATEPISQSVTESPAFGPADDPLNLNDFANSEVSAAKDGPLAFRVLISGIDTREIRESIREVLEDPRFAWDSNEIFSKISKGHLAINGLSPVKASILVTRIKRLPVEIRWEQYAIAQGQP